MLADSEEMAATSLNAEKECGLALIRAERLLALGRPNEAREETGGLSRERCPFTWIAVPEVKARALVAEGDIASAVTAYREVVDPPYPRPALEFDWRIPALFELATLEEQQGDLAGAREHYGQYLAHWGEADFPIPEVEEAAARLAKLRSP